MRASEYAFQSKHLLPTEELATAMRPARVSMRPTDRIQAWYAKSAFISSAHCGITADAAPAVVADSYRDISASCVGSLRLTATLRCNASHPLRWRVGVSVAVDASGTRLRKDNRTDGDESVTRPYFCVCVKAGVLVGFPACRLWSCGGSAGVAIVYG